ncbi:hypothetical protein AVEN_89024-1 [Araneus ventricosus]|uniref:Uncharacterized protein n=1 Tax=Araneus ventricosus TaxID=182803 RepID=A0A4Y2HFW1_ARAVE|nr:hypothetical protein AVEN_89024-1 [Araneus ventricosus]
MVGVLLHHFWCKVVATIFGVVSHQNFLQCSKSAHWLAHILWQPLIAKMPIDSSKAPTNYINEMDSTHALPSSCDAGQSLPRHLLITEFELDREVEESNEI